MLQEQEALQKWAEFNRQKWKCRVEVKRFQAPSSEAYCESLFFLDRKGKLIMPPINYYYPIIFTPTPTQNNLRINKQWLKVAEVMLQEMDRAGGSVDIALPPDIQDIRPWRWANFITNVKYTYRLELPYQDHLMEGSIRRRLNKAKLAGYETRLTDNMEDVYSCLVETEQRKGITHHLSLADLEMAREMLGPDIFRTYVCYSKDGEPASASVELVLSKKRALGLALGSKRAHLTSGANQLMTYFMFQDLSAMGVKGFDFCGANVPSVAESKSVWGAELVPYFTVRKRGLRDVFREGKMWLRHMVLIGGICGIGQIVGIGGV
ncbi:GNAT family N-acetyltransferase [Cohnella zeiphila]|uniref:GNAT family N-acetyltransferase n=1 Tax=Cohnella zeiphila TaxID=2761120 RepID=A0A7X0SN44_9BACL|nr:GNAT family N-acetyltransferase [Cohnella zeiphila]MBB6733063.1 GNAT family N-acetyltransferase [Cohnella zeiphila]